MVLTSWSPSTRSHRRWRRTWRRTRCRRRRRHLGLLESGQQIVTHRQLINRPGHLDRVFPYVVLENAFVSVEVCVPRLRLILDRILAHADSGQAGLTE